MNDERRLHPRAVVRLPAEAKWAKASEWEEVLLYDLSGGGAAILSRIPIEEQSQIDLRFRIPEQSGRDSPGIEVTCLVMRSATAAGHDPDRTFISGLHFLDLVGESFDQVRTYVWNLLHADED